MDDSQVTIEAPLSAYDISALKKSELRLNRSEKIGKIGNYEYDLVTKAGFWSDQVYELYQRDKKLGPPDDDEVVKYYTEEDHARLRGYIAQIVKTGKPVENFECPVKLPDGSTIICLGSMFPIVNELGDVVKIYGVLQDVTVQMKAQEKLEIQSKELQQLNYITSHNLKVPTTNINALLNLIDFSEMSEKNKVRLEMIRRSALSMTQTLKGLNEVVYAKNNFEILSEKILFSQCFNIASNELSHLIKESGAAISTNFSRVDELLFPKIHLISIVQNLLSNAIKYQHPDREAKIKIWSEKKQKGIALIVSDNGLGIDLELMKNKLFGLFQRYHTKQEGSGVGLYLVKTTVENYGGKVSVESEVDKGTKFTILFKKDNQP